MRRNGEDIGTTTRRPNGSASAIETAIELTRAEMSDTLQALQQKLSPGQIMDQALDVWRSGPRQYFSSLGEVAQRNPVPLAVAGFGLAWLMLTGAKPRIAEAAPPLGEGARRLGEATREKARRVTDRLDALADRQPLALGLLSLAIGATLAGLIPDIRQEKGYQEASPESAAATAADLTPQI